MINCPPASYHKGNWSKQDLSHIIDGLCQFLCLHSGDRLAKPECASSSHCIQEIIVWGGVLNPDRQATTPFPSHHHHAESRSPISARPPPKFHAVLSSKHLGHLKYKKCLVGESSTRKKTSGKPSSTHPTIQNCELPSTSQKAWDSIPFTSSGRCLGVSPLSKEEHSSSQSKWWMREQGIPLPSWP